MNDITTLWFVGIICDNFMVLRGNVDNFILLCGLQNLYMHVNYDNFSQDCFFKWLIWAKHNKEQRKLKRNEETI